MTQLDRPTLTPEEEAHVASGGRVFIVDEIPGPLFRVLMVNKERWRVLLKPQDAEGYIAREDAVENAEAIACLSDDRPLIRK